MTTFVVQNTWCQVFGADELLLSAMDVESRFRTTIVTARQEGFQAPEGEAGGWDGWVRLLRRPVSKPPYFPTGLLGRLRHVAEMLRYPVEIQDQRRRPMEGIPEHAKIPLRPYQQEAVARGVQLGRGVFDMPPRAGKTRVLSALVDQLALTVLWVAPTDAIVQQTAKVVEGFFGKNFVMHLIGSNATNVEAAINTRVVVCTSATVLRLPREFFASREVLIVDEWHHGAARTFHWLFKQCEHIYFRYGATGTNFRSGEDELALRALLSETIYKIDSATLCQLGFLVPTHVVFMPVPAHPKVRGGQESFVMGVGKRGIHEHRGRSELVTQAVTMLHRAGRKVCVLVGTKAQGRLLQHMIEAFIPSAGGTEFRRVTFLSTDVPRPVQKRILEAYLDPESTEVQVLIGTSLIGEGVDLPAVDALVYARGEKAEVTLIQGAYRCCTAVPGKRDAIIVDFADRQHKRLLEHSEERLGSYHREPLFSVTILPHANQLGVFLSQFQPQMT